jgi:hypothetical protein
MINKTENFTFPLDQRTNAAIVRKWHECVGQFCRSVGIDLSDTHEVTFVRCGHDLTQAVEQDVLIMRKNQEIGRVKTYLKQTPAGLKFTIACTQISPEFAFSPAEEKEATETP